MGKIIALGGGEIGRPHEKGGVYPIETTSIDQEIISQTKKKNPKLLFIPTASSDSKGYFKIVKKHFSKLGCEVNVLYLIKEKLSKKQIEEKILATDIIYVGGGNTLKMMTLWRKLGVDDLLRKAHHQGIVLSGLSAGSICWFKYGNSDSRKFAQRNDQLIKVAGLGLINALHCPHYDLESNRQEDLKKMMKTTPKIVAIALDNCCALEVIDNKYRILNSKPTAKAYKIYWKTGKYFQEEIPPKKEFEKLDNLLKK
ncbi:type 1 glutamine amidotransferase-like domain-containing protein [Candidatus Woesearchaeota archaeon]|jgi:dipeptidase E|nr:type 1 glutamine amidotransferase-like domain-containing protein [Candidatus Woesearchaeota archaeon]